MQLRPRRYDPRRVICLSMTCCQPFVHTSALHIGSPPSPPVANTFDTWRAKPKWPTHGSYGQICILLHPYMGCLTYFDQRSSEPLTVLDYSLHRSIAAMHITQTLRCGHSRRPAAYKDIGMAAPFPQKVCELFGIQPTCVSRQQVLCWVLSLAKHLRSPLATQKPVSERCSSTTTRASGYGFRQQGGGIAQIVSTHCDLACVNLLAHDPIQV